MSRKRPSVSAVVVSYNVAELLHDCLVSLERARAAGELDEVIVVDSSSSDSSVAMVGETFPDATVRIVPNRGYGAAVNIGLDCFRRRDLRSQSGYGYLQRRYRAAQ
ncbi:MAG: glycosyltransferase [Thermomicrobiales bacterium]